MNNVSNVEPIAELKDLTNKIREHKHNYAEDFGLVVSAPIQNLFHELRSYPEMFNIDETENIVQAYKSSIECRVLYENLGLSLFEQLNRLKKKVIPQIKKNKLLFEGLLKKHESFNNRGVIAQLMVALAEIDGVCDKLSNIEHFDYGTPVPFSLSAVLKDAFIKKNKELSTREGVKTIQFDKNCNFGAYSEIMVNLNEDSFRSHCLGNIIRNFNEHAFCGFDDSQLLNNSKFIEITENWLKKNNWFTSIPYLGSFFLRRLLKREIKNIPTKEKKVKVIFAIEDEVSKILSVKIENNGAPFLGDVKAVFNLGVGDNGEEHGIGLYSAKNYIESVGGTIEMYIINDDEYTVGFEIKIPIYDEKV